MNSLRLNDREVEQNLVGFDLDKYQGWYYWQTVGCSCTSFED